MEANLSKVDKKTSRAVDANGKDDDLIILSTGVVLRAKQANPNILIRVAASNPRPRPPVVFMEAMGREMENPDHPDYIEQVKSWDMEYNSAMLNALILLGTELVSVPKKFPKPEDDSWLKEYRVLGMPTISDSPSWRYLTWVMFMAAINEADTAAIGKKVKKLSGVQEADVRDAETFPDGDKTDGGNS